VDTDIVAWIKCVTVNIIWKILHSRWTLVLRLEWIALQWTFQNLPNFYQTRYLVQMATSSQHYSLFCILNILWNSCQTPIPTSHQPPGFSSSLQWTNSLFTALINLRSTLSTLGWRHFDIWVYTLCCCVLTFPPYTNAKPKVYLGAETCANHTSTSACLLAIPAFDRIAVLHNRNLNCNRGICLR